MKTIKYIKGLKYQLVEPYMCMTPVVGYDIDSHDFHLFADGRLLIRDGFAWDGASGPTFDTDTSMAPSAVHDVFCILMRDGRLSYEDWQDRVNEFFKLQCIAVGMWGWRANLWHIGVEAGDAGNPEQGADREVFEAPAP